MTATPPDNPSPEPDGPHESYPSLVDRSVVITGPTASGKSDLGIELAKRADGEIISLDSIAVYRGMNIGTAKPSAEQQAEIPHHLIDVVDPCEEFSVARYLQEAHRIVGEIRQRGRLPIFVGGTPMFLKGVLRGFDPGPPADWEFRSAVEEEVKAHGTMALHQRLWDVDPLAASKIAPTDTRRMIRALEVAKITGEPMSHRQVHFENAVAATHCRAYVVQWERATLHQRIDTRVTAMFERGLLEEVQCLLDQHGELSRTAAQAVGYRELLSWLAPESMNASDDQQTDKQNSVQQEPPTTLIEVQEQIAAHTRQLARRQETWFRSFRELTPVCGMEMQDTQSRMRWIENVIAWNASAKTSSPSTASSS